MDLEAAPDLGWWWEFFPLFSNGRPFDDTKEYNYCLYSHARDSDESRMTITLSVSVSKKRRRKRLFYQLNFIFFWIAEGDLAAFSHDHKANHFKSSALDVPAAAAAAATSQVVSWIL